MDANSPAAGTVPGVVINHGSGASNGTHSSLVANVPNAAAAAAVAAAALTASSLNSIQSQATFPSTAAFLYATQLANSFVTNTSNASHQRVNNNQTSPSQSLSTSSSSSTSNIPFQHQSTAIKIN